MIWIIKSATIAFVVVLLVIGVVLYFLLSNNSSNVSNEFAQCLTDKGATMYGAYWCSACKAQKNIFGSSFQYINYVECDANGENGDPQLCQEKQITGYPTWIINNKKYDGVRTPTELSQLTGCSLS